MISHRWVIRCRNRYIAHEKPTPGNNTATSLAEAFKFATEQDARSRFAALDNSVWSSQGVVEPVEVPNASP